MEYFGFVAFFIILAVGYFKISSLLLKLRHYSAVKNDTAQIVAMLRSNHSEFFDKSSHALIDDAEIQLEFRLLPFYKEAFKAHGIILFEAAHYSRKHGFSHALAMYNNVILVKNYVDITSVSERIA